MTHALTLSPEILSVLNQRSLPVMAVLAVKTAVIVTKWATNRRTRAALAQLEPWQLKDVGLTPAQASDEAAKVFWKS